MDIEMKITKTVLEKIVKNIKEELSWENEYTSFVQTLSKTIGDPKVKAFIGAGSGEGSEDDFAISSPIALPVSNLKPTQNEVDIDKSLVYPLIKNPESFINFITLAGSPYTLGSPIVTFNQEFIIDGHHRWSQLYACNPKAKIKCINLTLKAIGPLDALKAVQASIGYTINKVPMQSVEGGNLYTLSGDQIRAWILKNVPKSPLPQMILDNPAAKEKLMKLVQTQAVNPDVTGKENEKTDSGETIKEANQMAAELIRTRAIPLWITNNIATMRKNASPVAGAGPRNYMPQTGKFDWMGPLDKGKIDIAKPHPGQSAGEKTQQAAPLQENKKSSKKIYYKQRRIIL